MANVILKEAEFESLITRIKKQDDRIKELEAANLFLNDQIKEYNKEFTMEKGL